MGNRRQRAYSRTFRATVALHRRAKVTRSFSSGSSPWPGPGVNSSISLSQTASAVSKLAAPVRASRPRSRLTFHFGGTWALFRTPSSAEVTQGGLPTTRSGPPRRHGRSRRKLRAKRSPRRIWMWEGVFRASARAVAAWTSWISTPISSRGGSPPLCLSTPARKLPRPHEGSSTRGQRRPIGSGPSVASTAATSAGGV